MKTHTRIQEIEVACLECGAFRLVSGLSNDELGLCPICGDRTLGPQMYCLYCDRWGLDFLVPMSQPPVAAPPRRT